MNKIKCFLSLLFTVGLIASCAPTTPEKKGIREMIPEDAVGVISVDVPSLIKKSKMVDSTGVIKIPDALNKVIEDGDPSIIADVISNLPNSGVNLDDTCYLFFSSGILKTVALLPLTDEKKASAFVAKIASGKMKPLADVNIATHLDYAYAIDNNVLLIAHCSKDVKPEEAAKAAADIFRGKKPSLLSKKAVAQVVDTKGSDVNIYLNARGIDSLLNGDSTLNSFLLSRPIFNFIAETDVKAVTASVIFDIENKDGELAKIKTHLIFDDKGQYSKIYDKVIASKTSNASSTLDLIPGELANYVGLKINGSELSHLPQMKKIYQSLEANPLSKGLKSEEIIKNVDGALVFGADEGQVGDNVVVALQSSQPQQITDQIVELAENRGQSPLERDDEIFYEYKNQGIAMGETDNAFYLRCVDFETQYSAIELPVLPQNLDKCSIVVFKMLSIGNNVEGFFNWGQTDKANGEGFYFSEDEKCNIVISVLKLLCWKDPNSNIIDDDFDS